MYLLFYHSFKIIISCVGVFKFVPPNGGELEKNN